MDALWVIVALLVIAGIAIGYSVAATISLLRTRRLNSAQRWVQGVISWLVPIVGPLLVMYLLAEYDRESIPCRWTENSTIDSYVWQLLTGHSRIAYKAGALYVETAIVDAIGDAFDGGGEFGDGVGD